MARILDPGERFPDFVLPGVTGQPAHLYAHTGGRPVLVILLGNGEQRFRLPENVPSVASDVVVVSSVPAETSGICFVDSQGSVLPKLLNNQRFLAYVLDANLRVVRVFRDIPSIEVVEEAFQAIPVRAPQELTNQAPILLVDSVLSHERCGFLMQLWEEGGSVETGVEQSTPSGRRPVISERHKARRDHTVADPKLIQLLTQLIGRRVLSEIERAFIYRPTRFEGFKIACYDSAESGFFHAHRDNLSPKTAHRRLAVSINLNTDFEGGGLRFPEFGSDRYRSEAGSARIVSCAHLHEVLPVTKGKRFALLTFLYDETSKRDAIDPFAV